MQTRLDVVRSVAGVGLAWAALWMAGWTLAFGITDVVDPDTIDPGEEKLVFQVFGPMGLLSGIAFALLTTRLRSRVSEARLSLLRAAGWGFAGTAIVQLFYLGHGDAGLVSNLGVALLCAVLGAAVAVVWLLLARRWWAWRSSRVAHS